jgi:hypothetical protein
MRPPASSCAVNGWAANNFARLVEALGLPVKRRFEVRSGGDWCNAASSCNLRMSLRLPELPIMPRAELGVLRFDR